MATIQKNHEFSDTIISRNNILDEAIGWIKDNMDLDDVFDGKEIKKYVAENYHPEQVFQRDELRDWAESNGYTKD